MIIMMITTTTPIMITMITKMVMNIFQQRLSELEKKVRAAGEQILKLEADKRSAVEREGELSITSC